MQFFQPQHFVYLWSIPAVMVIFWISQKEWRKRITKLGNPQIIQSKLIPLYNPGEKGVRTFYLILALIFLTLSLARPQWGEEKKKIQRKGVDVIFLLDTSLSMLAEDIKPNRLEKSKLEMKSFVKKLKGDRVGIVAFAGTGFLQSPLTIDYAAFFLFLDGIKTGYIPDPGTSLDRALRIAANSFSSEEHLKHKAIVLFTDGEDHEGGIENALKEVKKSGIRIYAIGVGTANGDPIPLRDEDGRKSGFKKDREGKIVITKLNQPLLENIASETGGVYLPATPGEQEVDVILKHMESLDKRQFQEKTVTEKEDHYQLFLFFGFFFLGLEMLVQKTKKNAAQALSLLALFLLLSGFLKGPKALNDEGNKNFTDKRYQTALEAYRKAQVKKPDDPAIRYNLGTTLYQLQQYQDAAKELEQAVENSKGSKELEASAYYNYGNAQYRLGNFEKAIEAYEKTLELTPDDKDAKYNLEFLQKQKSLFDKKNEERKKEQQEKEKKQPKQQQQKQQNQNQNQQQQQQQQQQSQQQNQQQNQPSNEEQNPSDGQEEGKDQSQKPSEENQEQEKQEQDSDQTDSKKQDKEEEKQEEQKEQEKEQARPEEGQEDEQKEEPQPAQEESGSARKPLQGQMTMENALRVLDALKESEKELQDLRRPPLKRDPVPVAKDW